MTYRLDPNADTNEISLRTGLPTVTAEAMRLCFGKESPNGYFEPERGYDGLDWIFVNDDGHVFKVYARYGAFRIGARDGADCEAFAKWLLERLRLDFVRRLRERLSEPDRLGVLDGPRSPKSPQFPGTIGNVCGEIGLGEPRPCVLQPPEEESK